VCFLIVYMVGHFVRGFYHQYSQTRKMVFMVLIIPVVTLKCVASVITVYCGEWECSQ
jgi:sugar phosphate permease